MFQFNFDVDDRTEDVIFADLSAAVPPTTDRDAVPSELRAFSEIDLESLLEALPTQISYSFVSSSPSDGHASDLKLARRDLFDVRFQLISEGTGDLEAADPSKASDEFADPSLTSALQFIDNPSDLVPSVYEGGLKTWECSVDLASYLKRAGHATNARGQRVLELGCGTAIPTLCILQEIFKSPTIGDMDAETHVHLQDYNTSVLKLVTMPNIILAWYTSPAAEAFRNSDSLTPEARAQDSDTDLDSVLHITSDLLAAFTASLHSHRLYLRFFSGSWDTFDFAVARTGTGTGGPPYHLVLSSETMYHLDSLSSLVRVLRNASCADSHGDGDGNRDETVCLVAGKTVYFGVGGGVVEFARCVGSSSFECEQGIKIQGRVETVWEKTTGVRRSVMRVRWT